MTSVTSARGGFSTPGGSSTCLSCCARWRGFSFLKPFMRCWNSAQFHLARRRSATPVQSVASCRRCSSRRLNDPRTGFTWCVRTCLWSGPYTCSLSPITL